jgi:cell division protein FtsW (lipid II flippase)
MAERGQERTHTVRPRWTWIALLVLIVGMLVIAAGNLGSSTVVVLVGIVLMVVGGAAALYGGFFYDVQGGASIPAQVSDVKEGAVHEFPGADTIRHEDEVKRDVHDRWLSDDG